MPSQSCQPLVSPYKRVLRYILCQMVIAQDVQRHGAGRPFVTFDKYGKSLLFTVQDGIYQFSICSHVTTFLLRSASTIKSKLKAKMRQENRFS